MKLNRGLYIHATSMLFVSPRANIILSWFS